MAVTLPSASAIENLKKTLEREEQRRIEREQAGKTQVVHPAPAPEVVAEPAPESPVEELIQAQDSTDTSVLTTPSKPRRR
jgi:hypothetical protein